MFGHCPGPPSGRLQDLPLWGQLLWFPEAANTNAEAESNTRLPSCGAGGQEPHVARQGSWPGSLLELPARLAPRSFLTWLQAPPSVLAARILTPATLS